MAGVIYIDADAAVAAPGQVAEVARRHQEIGRVRPVVTRAGSRTR